MNDNLYDSIIIGGGPAGVSCALELQETRKNFLLLEGQNRLGGQLHLVHNPIANLSSGPYKDGRDLLSRLEQLVSELHLAHRLQCQVTSVNLQTKEIQAGNLHFRGKTVVLATGYRKRLLELPQAARYAPQITYHHHACLPHIAGKNVAVIGGGDNAVMDALDLSRHCRQVYLLKRSQHWKARPDLVQALHEQPNITILSNTQISQLMGQDGLSHIKVKNDLTQEHQVLPVSQIVIKIGDLPNTELFQGQVALDESGHVLIDAYGRTSLTGVFAAGDIASPGYPRLATAAGQGSLAAWGIRQLLEPQITLKT